MAWSDARVLNSIYHRAHRQNVWAIKVLIASRLTYLGNKCLALKVVSDENFLQRMGEKE